MDEISALIEFLGRGLARRKNRYIDFASRPKTRKKFLASIYHDLESDLDMSACVTSLPDSILDQPAYWYSPPKQYGEPVPSLRDLFDSQDDAFLAITQDGKAGIYQPETFIDSRRLFLWS